MRNIQSLVLCVLIACMTNVYADDIEQRLKNVFDDQAFEIAEYDDQLKEVVVGSQSFFATHDGKYLFSGAVYDTDAQKNLIEMRAAQTRAAQLTGMDFGLSYPAIKPAKYTVTVFTDIDCPYCRKLHDYMNEFNQRGITVNYVMLPRAGAGSPSFQKTVSALCDKKPAQAITQAMAGQMPTIKSCQHTLDDQMKLAADLKIHSTPTIVLPNGRMKMGLTSPDQLLLLLNQSEP